MWCSEVWIGVKAIAGGEKWLDLLSGVVFEGDLFATRLQRRPLEVGHTPALVDEEMVGDAGDDILGALGVDFFGGEVDRVARDAQVFLEALVDCLASTNVKTQ